MASGFAEDDVSKNCFATCAWIVCERTLVAASNWQSLTVSWVIRILIGSQPLLRLTRHAREPGRLKHLPIRLLMRISVAMGGLPKCLCLKILSPRQVDNKHWTSFSSHHTKTVTIGSSSMRKLYPMLEWKSCSLIPLLPPLGFIQATILIFQSLVVVCRAVKRGRGGCTIY